MPKMKPSLEEQKVLRIIHDVRNRLYVAMKDRHITQAELAEVLCITQATMSRKMNRPELFTLEELARAANKLEVEL